ncbi:MAG: hypothetical protein PHS48_02650 [Bacteroidales bacterium]|jgi:hypothetical protein|nr:hypothetical protein [Bacteroidales bacterium]
MKNLQIKIWPEIEGLSPIIAPWEGINNRSNDLFLDFSNCHSVYSSTLVLILIRILKLLSSENNNKKWETHNERISDTFKNIIDLNFFYILDLYAPNTNIFWDKEFSQERKKVLIQQNQNGNKVHSFPILLLGINKYSNRRDILVIFRQKFNQILSPYYNKYNFNLNQLMLILSEILKNSADHTNSNAFLGLDIEFIKNDAIIIKIGIGDLGIGINMNVKNHLPKEQNNRYDFWDLTQTYRFALSKGSTTKMESIYNKGMGMSIILNGARGLGMNLFVFDADSRGLLTNINNLTHSEIRKNFYNIGHHTGFYYYVTLKAKKI